MRKFLACLFAVVHAFSLFAQTETDNYQLLLDKWRKPGVVHSDELREKLIDAAIHAEQPAVIEEIFTGGDPSILEIKLPAGSEKTALRIVRNLGEMPWNPYRDSMDCVIRRMTPLCFEEWTPKHGWLFNAKGQLLNEAIPPRRDGTGREWHGAFLPDGSWITTDLWEMDKTITFFSRSGKWLREVNVVKIAPEKDDYWNQSLVGWGRCDRHGAGWVASIGEGPGRARIFVKKSGAVRVLKDDDAPWKLCYPRDLEPKGMYTSLDRPSDDFQNHINFSVPGHGMYVGYPTYSWGEEKTWGNVVIPDGDHYFGFLPGSHDVYIGASDLYHDEAGAPGGLKTWFFDSAGKCRGWVRATYLADSANGKGMCFRDGDNCVLMLDRRLKLLSRVQFTLEGKAARPVKLFTDLKLGFFRSGNDLVLASW